MKKNILTVAVITFIFTSFSCQSSKKNELSEVAEFVWNNQPSASNNLLIVSKYFETDSHKFYSSFFSKKPHPTSELLLSCLQKIDTRSIFIMPCIDSASKDYIKLLEDGFITKVAPGVRINQGNDVYMIILNKGKLSRKVLVPGIKFFVEIEHISSNQNNDKLVFDSIARYYLK